MNKIPNFCLCLLLIGCANIVAPTGGKKDTAPPRILSVDMTENNKQNKTLVFEFDEYIQFNKWEENFFVSPPVKNSVKKNIKGHKLILKIEGTLLPSTYYISLNDCIKDNNEGNILDKLEYRFSIKDIVDTLSLYGSLRDAYTLEPLERFWVMLFSENVHDTVIFNSTPSYIARTNFKGDFYFTNLNEQDYKVVSVAEGDFVYDKEEKIAFLDSMVNAQQDSIISLFAFKPIDKTPLSNIDTLMLNSDSIFLDSTIQSEANSLASLQINTNSPPGIFQLLQNDSVKIEASFNNEPYRFEKIPPGAYKLKYIFDVNKDGLWNTGIWEMKIQPEKVVNYPSEVTIRSNWDLQLDWSILE